MNLINHPFLFILVAVLSAFLAIQYQEYLGHNMILFQFKKKVLNRLPENLAKPLGLCIFCNSFWVAVSIYVYFCFRTFSFELDVLLFTSINYITIKIYTLITNK